MNVTFNSTTDGIDAINTAASAFAKAQMQVATGKRINTPSDDPQGTKTAILERSYMDQLDAYSASADAASSRLSAADSTLSDVINQITSAISTATGAQGSTATSTVRDAAATALAGIQSALAADINTSVQGVHIFAGTATTATPYAQVNGAWVYQGNNTPVKINVQAGRSVTIGFDGQAIFQGSASTDLLSTINGLITSIKGGDDAGTATGIQALQDAFTRATVAQTSLGSDENSVTNASSQLSTLYTAADSRRSKVEDANLALASTTMSQADTAYKAALGAVSATEKVTLLDYLK
jgi:flagellar hook-associated protein 3 FlgL